MNGFAWLNELMTWLGRWVPRVLLIPPTHRGVRFGPRGGATEVGPGLVVYWPITHQIVEVPMTTQSMQLCSQLIPLASSEGVLLPRVTVVAAAVQYRVVDAVIAATSALNLHALIDNRASAAIARHSDSAAITEWARRVRSDLDDEVRSFGVAVERLDFTQNGTGVALKNLSDWAYTDTVNGKRAE